MNQLSCSMKLEWKVQILELGRICEVWNIKVFMISFVQKNLYPSGLSTARVVYAQIVTDWDF
jgi:hypothetical protein